MVNLEQVLDEVKAVRKESADCCKKTNESLLKISSLLGSGSATVDYMGVQKKFNSELKLKSYKYQNQYSCLFPDVDSAVLSSLGVFGIIRKGHTRCFRFFKDISKFCYELRHDFKFFEKGQEYALVGGFDLEVVDNVLSVNGDSGAYGSSEFSVMGSFFRFNG